MKTYQKSGPVLICFALLIVITILVSAGCLESTPNPQDQMTATSDKQSENPAAGMTVTAMTTIARPTPAPDLFTPFITIDPPSDKNVGDLLVISGTTNLPEKTPIYISKTYGSSGEVVMMANKQVLPGTNGINRWRFAFDTSGFKPGSYNLTVATGKKGVAGTAQFSLRGTFLGTDSPVYYSGVSMSSGSAGTPSITVQPPGDRQQGDVFLIAGTTSLAQGTILLYQVYPVYFEDKTKRSPSSSPVPLGIAGDTIVIKGTGNSNRWSCALDTEGYEKTSYIVNVSTVNENYALREIFGSAQFTLR